MSDDQAPDHLALDRRSLLKAGAASLGGLFPFGGNSESRRGPVHRVGPNESFQTIQAAYDAFDRTGGRLRVTHAYDARRESFPIQLNRTDGDGNGIPFVLEGDDAGETVIDASGSGANALDVVGPGADYQRTILIRNLRVRGGRSGVVLRRCPYGRLENVLVHQCQEHGVALAEADIGTFGCSFANVGVLNCGYNGFRLAEGANTHGVTFSDCRALLCGRADTQYAGVHLRNSSVRWFGGVIQQNHGYGIDVRNSHAPYICGAYFEGNGTQLRTPLDVYIGATHTDTDREGAGVYAPVIEGCYFNGGIYYTDNPHGNEVEARAVNVQKAFGGGVSACAYRNYSEAFLAIFGDTNGTDADVVDFDIARSSHTDIDRTRNPTPFVTTTNGYRLRDDGMIVKQDLARHGVVGAYDGDRAIHDGNGFPQLAIWSASDDAWYLPDGSTVAEPSSNASMPR